jgi:hypothetical protein
LFYFDLKLLIYCFIYLVPQFFFKLKNFAAHQYAEREKKTDREDEEEEKSYKQ